jgi:diguanylate cyclase (GGDEF)-like protein
VRKAAETSYFSSAGVKLTVSAGVAVFPAHGDDALKVRDAADRALYAAKLAGRNRTVSADGDC